MTVKLILRIAAIFVFIHMLGHGVGHFSWRTPKDPKMQEVVNIMQDYKGEFMGASKSMGDYYNGYSLIMFFVFGMTICLLFFISGFAQGQPEIAKKLLYPIGITYLCFSVIEYISFFPFAAGISFLAGMLILVGAYMLPRIEI